MRIAQNLMHTTEDRSYTMYLCTEMTRKETVKKCGSVD